MIFINQCIISSQDFNNQHNIEKPINIVEKYQWILFDADDTLFDFDAFAGLKLMFTHFDIDFTEYDYKQYQKANKTLWQEYQAHTIPAETVKRERFKAWSKKLSVDGLTLNSAFLQAMAEVCKPFTGVVQLLDKLQHHAKLGIITNGFTELQAVRLEYNGLSEHFELVVISEQVGVAKPHIDIFTHALELMGNPAPDKVLMIGDNLNSDIIGGLNAGMDTCWLNRKNSPQQKGIRPTYQVTSHVELDTLLMKPA